MTRSETKLSTAIPAPISGYQQWMLWRQRKMFDVTLTKMATFEKKNRTTSIAMNNHYLFISGQCGTGKHVLLRNNQKRMHILLQLASLWSYRFQQPTSILYFIRGLLSYNQNDWYDYNNRNKSS